MLRVHVKAVKAISNYYIQFKHVIVCLVYRLMKRELSDRLEEICN